MHKLYHPSPLIYSSVFSRLLGSTVYLKIESLQPSGSFKNRGIGFLCQYQADQGCQGFVTSSGGNAGIAVAYSGRVLNKPVKVVIPETTPKMISEKIRAEHAEVILCGKIWDDADKKARAIAEECHFSYIHPFDERHIWDGHATLVDELAETGVHFDAIALSVGGGGLFSGIAQGCFNHDWQNIEFITAETEGAASFAKSLEAGKLVTLDKIETIALTLGAKQVTHQALEWASRFTVHPELVTDKAAVTACLRFCDDHRLMVEPACGATLALLYEQRKVLKQFKTIGVIVCGGNSVSRALLNKWEKDYQISIST